MKRKAKRLKYKVGDIIACAGLRDMEYTINELAKRGVDCKPCGYNCEIEILSIERKIKKK